MIVGFRETVAHRSRGRRPSASDLDTLLDTALPRGEQRIDVRPLGRAGWCDTTSSARSSAARRFLAAAGQSPNRQRISASGPRTSSSDVSAPVAEMVSASASKSSRAVMRSPTHRRPIAADSRGVQGSART